MSVPKFVRDIFRVNEEDEYYEEYEVEEEMEEEPETQFHQEENSDVNSYSDRRNPNVKTMKPTNKKIVEMRGVTNGNAEVMVIEPRTFDEMPKVIDSLRERKSVVLNLEMMDPQEAQRAVDFVAGGTYAMDGHYERVGESIFLFTPSCVTVSNLSGLISGTDDFTSARSRRSTSNNPADPWFDSNMRTQQVNAQ